MARAAREPRSAMRWCSLGAAGGTTCGWLPATAQNGGAGRGTGGLGHAMDSAHFLYRPIAFHTPDRVVDPPSWLGHTPFAFWIVDALQPTTFVELGCHSGNSYSSFAQAVQTLACRPRVMPSIRGSAIRMPGPSMSASSPSGPIPRAALHLIFPFDQVDVRRGARTFLRWRHRLAAHRRLSHVRRGVARLRGVAPQDERPGRRAVPRHQRSREGLRGLAPVGARVTRISLLCIPPWPRLGVLGIGRDLPEPLQWLFATDADEANTVHVLRPSRRLGDGTARASGRGATGGRGQIARRGSIPAGGERGKPTLRSEHAWLRDALAGAQQAANARESELDTLGREANTLRDGFAEAKHALRPGGASRHADGRKHRAPNLAGDRRTGVDHARLRKSRRSRHVSNARDAAHTSDGRCRVARRRLAAAGWQRIPGAPDVALVPASGVSRDSGDRAAAWRGTRARRAGGDRGRVRQRHSGASRRTHRARSARCAGGVRTGPERRGAVGRGR